MDRRQLFYFIAIVEERSTSAVLRRLYISQSTPRENTAHEQYESAKQIGQVEVDFK